MSTCFVAGIVKGLVEHGDATRHFGSLIGFETHMQQAVNDGVVNADESLTDAGEAWYYTAKLSELEDCRAYFWDRDDWVKCGERNGMPNEQNSPAVAGQVERRVMQLPEPVPRYCCGDRLRPCRQCGADVWGIGKDEYGSLANGGSCEIFECGHCGNEIYVQLPD